MSNFFNLMVYEVLVLNARRVTNSFELSAAERG